MAVRMARRPAPEAPPPGRHGSRVPARLLRRASDERLVAYVRDGSEAAFEVLFDRYYRGLVGFCLHMLGSVEEAEDAVQHTFLAAFSRIVNTDRRVELRPWLYTVARNRCLTLLHARRERPGIPLTEPATEHLFAEVQRREEVRDLLGDLARLPEDQRAALLLAEAGAMPHTEIAAVLGCPQTKVKALVFQARSSLSATRTARATPCKEIREQIATLPGRALRRRTIRRHLPDCAGCREFRDEVLRQRRALAVALPLAWSLALKEAVMAALFGAGAAGAGGAAAGAGSAGALAAKALAVVALLGAGGAGLAVRHDDPPANSRAAAPPEHPARAQRDAENRPTERVAVPATPVARERSDERAPRRRTGVSPRAHPLERAIRRENSTSPAQEEADPQTSSGQEQPDEASTDEATEGGPQRPRRDSETGEPEPPRPLTPRPAPMTGAPSPEPIHDPVDASEDSDDDADDDAGERTAVDDEDSDEATASEDDDDEHEQDSDG
jgi:RNA polymerase sigma factor (sigma-70 family)